MWNKDAAKYHEYCLSKYTKEQIFTSKNYKTATVAHQKWATRNLPKVEKSFSPLI